MFYIVLPNIIHLLSCMKHHKHKTTSNSNGKFYGYVHFFYKFNFYSSTKICKQFQFKIFEFISCLSIYYHFSTLILNFNIAEWQCFSFILYLLYSCFKKQSLCTQLFIWVFTVSYSTLYCLTGFRFTQFWKSSQHCSYIYFTTHS